MLSKLMLTWLDTCVLSWVDSAHVHQKLSKLIEAAAGTSSDMRLDRPRNPRRSWAPSVERAPD